MSNMTRDVLTMMILLRILNWDCIFSGKNLTTILEWLLLLILLGTLSLLLLFLHIWESRDILLRDLMSTFFFRIRHNSYGVQNQQMENSMVHYRLT